MTDIALTRGAAREAYKYLETPGWCPPTGAHAYRAGAISERLQIAFGENLPEFSDPKNVTMAEQKLLRAWLAEPIGEVLDKREIAVVTTCITYHRDKLQISPNIHLTRLFDYLDMAPKEE